MMYLPLAPGRRTPAGGAPYRTAPSRYGVASLLGYAACPCVVKSPSLPRQGGVKIHLATAVFARASHEARRLRQNWIGPEHCLLAILAQPSVATEVMAELGATHESVNAQLLRLKSAVKG